MEKNKSNQYDKFKNTDTMINYQPILLKSIVPDPNRDARCSGCKWCYLDSGCNVTYGEHTCELNKCFE